MAVAARRYCSTVLMPESRSAGVMRSERAGRVEVGDQPRVSGFRARSDVLRGLSGRPLGMSAFVVGQLRFIGSIGMPSAKPSSGRGLTNQAPSVLVQIS